MTEILQKTLRDNAVARWAAMLLVSFTMLCAYFLTDVMSPLEDMLVRSGWTSSEYGFLSGSYGLINVFLLMLFFGGLILDKMGIRFTGILAAVLMVVGAFVKYAALKMPFDPNATLFGVTDPAEITRLVGESGWKRSLFDFFNLHTQVAAASLGFAIFGVGAEIMGITASKIIVKWFTGRNMALAMGLQVALARVGTALALAYSLPFAAKYSLSAPVLLGVILLCVGLLFYLIYCVMDKRLDNSSAQSVAAEAEEGFHLKDLCFIFTNKGFWLITILCLLFYSGVFPFLKFATKLMIYKYNVSPDWAGKIPAVLPFGTILLTPLFGLVYDRIGRGATLMIIGSLMLTVVHVLFALPLFGVWWFAVIVMVLLGIAFSLVPSAMWPSVPKIIPTKQLGSAYAIIFYIQNIGLALVPMFIGWLIDTYAERALPDGTKTYDYTVPMVVFALLGFISILVAVWLKREDARKHYGLEKANVE